MRYSIFAIYLAITGLPLAASSMEVEETAVHSRATSSEVARLVQMRLNAKGTSTKLLFEACSAGRALSNQEAFIASGYSQAAVPLDLLDDREEARRFCNCAIDIAERANNYAAARLGKKKIQIGQAKDGRLAPNTQCVSAEKDAVVSFTNVGLQLNWNGTPAFGGDGQFVSGHALKSTAGRSQSIYGR